MHALFYQSSITGLYLLKAVTVYQHLFLTVSFFSKGPKNEFLLISCMLWLFAATSPQKQQLSPLQQIVSTKTEHSVTELLISWYWDIYGYHWELIDSFVIYFFSFCLCLLLSSDMHYLINIKSRNEQLPTSTASFWAIFTSLISVK